MLPFTRILIAEHVRISRELDALVDLSRGVASPAPPSAENLRACLESIRELTREHHAKEEELLFPALDATGIPRQGGPRCTLFWGQRIERDLVGRILNEAPERKPEPAGSAIQALLDQNSPLSIPIEEHQAGHLALDLLDEMVADHEAGRGLDGQRFLRISRNYVEMLRMHIRKEDTCLFVMADARLDEGRQTELAREAERRSRRRLG